MAKKGKGAKKSEKNTSESLPAKKAKMKRKDYESELEKLQIELVQLQEWVKHTQARIIVIFEGRDAAGKGGVIKRITERVSPRVFRVVALPAPNDARPVGLAHSCRGGKARRAGKGVGAETRARPGALERLEDGAKR